jgi:hypothetical protein
VAYLSQLLAGFPGAHAVLKRSLPVKLTLNQVWQQALRVGRDLVERREAEVMKMLTGAPPAPPGNPPDLLVVASDGGRIQDRDRPVGDRWCEYKAAVVYRATRAPEQAAGESADPQPAPHWKYTAGTEGFQRRDCGEKRYEDPRPEVKTVTASTETVERFPLLVELEAKRRGMLEARTVAFVGDGGDFVWRTAREVGEERRRAGRETYEVLDLIHAGEHLVAAAKAALGVTPAGGEWLSRRSEELWGGKRDELLLALEQEAQRHGPRTAEGVAHTLWTTRDYFAEHRERIRYDVFRRHGLPLVSAHVESGIKQVNHRLKGSEKQWRLANAEAMLALRTAALSEDDRWRRHFEALRAGKIQVATTGRQVQVSENSSCAERPSRPSSPEPACRDARGAGRRRSRPAARAQRLCRSRAARHSQSRTKTESAV